MLIRIFLHIVIYGKIYIVPVETMRACAVGLRLALAHGTILAPATCNLYRYLFK